MRKVVVFGILLIMLAVVGCARQPQATPNEQPASEPANVQQSAQQPTQAQQQEPPKVITDARVKAILGNIAKVTSYTFSSTRGIVYVKGDNAKIKLFESGGKTGATKYDVVYLDLKDKKAYAVCVEVDLCPYEMRQQYREISYAEYDLGKLPPEYVNEITYAEIDYTTSRSFKRASALAKAYLFKYKINDVYYETWLDEFYGFPYEITMKKEKSQTRVAFNDVQINNVEDADVKLPPSLKPAT